MLKREHQNKVLLQNLKENVRTSVRELIHKRKWVMQQDNNPMHTSHSTKEWLKKNNVNVLVQTWIQLKCCGRTKSKQFIGGSPPTSEFMWFCTEEWATTPTRCFAGLISIYKKLTFSYCSKRGSHQILNGSFFSINKWQKICFSHLSTSYR